MALKNNEFQIGQKHSHQNVIIGNLLKNQHDLIE